MDSGGNAGNSGEVPSRGNSQLAELVEPLDFSLAFDFFGRSGMLTHLPPQNPSQQFEIDCLVDVEFTDKYSTTCTKIRIHEQQFYNCWKKSKTLFVQGSWEGRNFKTLFVWVSLFSGILGRKNI